MLEKYFNLGIVGNLFYLNKHIKVKTIYTSVLLTIIIGFLGFFLEGEIFGLFFPLKEFLYLLMGLSFLYLVLNYMLIVQFFKKYYHFTLITFVMSLMEIVLAVSIVMVYNKQLIGWILGIFWLFSGFLRILIQSTRALFDSEIRNFLKIVQIFAYTRAAYFSFTGLLILSLIPKTPISIFLFFLLIMFFLNLFLISNLNPYMIKHSSVRRAVELIRLIGMEKEIKLNKLSNMTKLSKTYFNRLVGKWDRHNFVNVSNKRVELSKTMRLIKDGK